MHGDSGLANGLAKVGPVVEFSPLPDFLSAVSQICPGVNCRRTNRVLEPVSLPSKSDPRQGSFGFAEEVTFPKAKLTSEEPIYVDDPEDGLRAEVIEPHSLEKHLIVR